MKRNQQGFTLLELVIVLVILGVLSAIALAKYMDMQSEANSSATMGVAGALAGGAAVNYGARKANSSKGVPVANCTAAWNTLQGSTVAGYTITALAIAADTSTTCALSGSGTTSTTFVAIGIS